MAFITNRKLRILIRGGGDLASGVALRCARAGWEVIITELAQPLAVRRTVSFSQAIYDGSITVEGMRAERAKTSRSVLDFLKRGMIAVLIDPECLMLPEINPDVLIDARMTKLTQAVMPDSTPFFIGLGPGFFAGENCHAVVETVRGPFLGRVIWNGPAERDTGIPDSIGAFKDERVLRAPGDGIFSARVQIGDELTAGELVAEVGELAILSPFKGVLRGLLRDGLEVSKGMKVGDVDPRNDPRLCWLVSDKSLAIGGGVLEAIMTWYVNKGNSGEHAR